METLAAHPHPEDSFAGMEVRGDTLTDKENAGAALLDACKEVKNAEPVQVGSYRGFAMSVSFDAFRQEYTLQLKGQMTHQATLGADPRGNLTRIDNALAQMPQRLESVKAQLEIFGFAPRHPIGSRIVPVGMGISKENGVLLCLGGPEGIGSPLRGESKETVGFVAHDFPSESLVCYTFASV